MRLNFLPVALILLVAAHCRSATERARECIVISEGSGFYGIAAGSGNADDVRRLLGVPSAAIKHADYSYELVYEARASSFFFKQGDPMHTIFAMTIGSPACAETQKGVRLGESTMRAVIRTYGQGQWRTSAGNDTWWLEYPNGTTFHVRADLPIVFPLDEAKHLDRTIVRIGLEKNDERTPQKPEAN